MEDMSFDYSDIIGRVERQSQQDLRSGPCEDDVESTAPYIDAILDDDSDDADFDTLAYFEKRMRRAETAREAEDVAASLIDRQVVWEEVHSEVLRALTRNHKGTEHARLAQNELVRRSLEYGIGPWPEPNT